MSESRPWGDFRVTCQRCGGEPILDSTLGSHGEQSKGEEDWVGDMALLCLGCGQRAVLWENW